MIVCCADTMLTLEVMSKGSKPGRPKLYDWQTLDKVINLWDNKRQTAKPDHGDVIYPTANGPKGSSKD